MIDKIIKGIKTIVGETNFSVSKSDCLCYAYDASNNKSVPNMVVFPKSTNDVSEILKLANEEKVFVIPRGAGTGMTGGSLAVKGGIVMAMTRMNRILLVDQDNLVADVEPGVITGDFHNAVEKLGLFYPPDPSSSAYSTLGGNLAECAGGPRAVKYGVTRDYVLGLEAVIPNNGEIIHTGVRTNKGVVGYDLTRLIVGSEGTLAVITKMTLKLLPLPKYIGTMTAYFDSMKTAAQTVSEIIRKGIIPRTIEYMDQAAIECAESYLKIGLPTDVSAMLLIEVDSNDNDSVKKELKELASICKSYDAKNIKIAESQKETALLWKARKSVSPALFRFGPDKINEDIVVPRSKIPELVEKINELRQETQLTMISFGHAGDGNIHFNIMLDKSDPVQYKKAERAVETLFDYTLELGGTISGEHGIGITKAPYFSKEIRPQEIELMKRIKQAFDPNGILNPGKIFYA